MAPILPLQRALLTLLALTAIVLTSTASAQAAIKVQPVRSFDAVEGARIPNDRIVVFEDTGDCAPGTYDIQISWGDGTTSAGAITFSDPVLDTNLNTIRCVYQAVGSHRYASPGALPLSARVTRGAESVVSAAGGTARVADAPIRAEGRPFGGRAGRSESHEVARFEDADRLQRASEYTATIAWGDGTSSAGTVTGGDGEFRVTGAHAYASAGERPVRVSLLEGGVVRSVATTTADIGAEDASGAGVGGASGAGAPTPVGGTAASRNETPGTTSRTLFRPALRLRSSTIRRSALGRGLRARLSVPASARSLRIAVVRLTAGTRKLGTVTVRLRGGRVADGVRRVDVRIPLPAALRRKMRAGGYALRFRIAGSGTVAAQFRVRR